MEPVKKNSTLPREPHWTTRDAVHDLFQQRDIYTTTTTTTTTKTTAASFSCHFDVETCLARIRRDKAAVVRVAFDTAATTVLHATTTTTKKSPIAEPTSSTTSTIDPVPLMQDYEKLQTLRVTSFHRAHDNKEFVSRSKAKEANEKKRKKKDSTTTTSTTTTTKKKKSSSTTLPTNTITSAASAASIDARSTISRAILCAAGTIAFEALTPPFPNHFLDVLDVPQQHQSNNTDSKPVNMGAVLLQAQTLGQRTASMVENASRRSKQRHEYRCDYFQTTTSNTSVVPSNPFGISQQQQEDEDPPPLISNDRVHQNVKLTAQWTNLCLPRLLSVLDKGSGHAIYCDLDWNTRHGRMAHLLSHLATHQGNYGPHLIVTTQPHVCKYAAAIQQSRAQLRVVSYASDDPLERAKLRDSYLRHMHGLPHSKAHVVVTSYKHFLEDYLFLCQVPYQVALLDQGMSWLSLGYADPNGSIAALWERGVWSSSDSHIGLAGTSHSFFHELFESAALFYENKDNNKRLLQNVGLTARYRIMATMSQDMVVKSHNLAPGLLNFLIPHFCDVVREEWDRSRIVTDAPSMEHFQKLATRAIVVHAPSVETQDLYQLAMDAMKGTLAAAAESMDSVETSEENQDEQVPSLISDETFVASGKVSQSRRSALSLLGPAPNSWLRYELGSASFQSVLKAMKQSNAQGQVCEEIVTASSTTSSGAGGAVSGTQAYRLAVRCGRNFGSEQGLRQHMAALHAPPGTWLCRTCGGDCGTSQARTHHERSCGQPAGGNQGNPAGGGVSTVGQGVRQQQSAGKRSKAGGGGASTGDAGESQDKDKDGSFRVPSYRGVWVNPTGKHFVKINGNPLKDEKDEGANVLLFDSIEEAARKYDQIISEKDDSEKPELNYNPDGTRIEYQESAPAGRSLDMLGGDASSVVPALSVINIKDLPNGVKPLLRDPRQTSRTGGNSKRHIYAYRGVCRQARKGHDRWQSQISFGGTNHYLGTFDSEWDAAAIYAWAHLILYGEEATKQAQKEGEEAAAAYEQEKKDIAAGKIIVPPPKPPKKKVAKKKEKKGAEADGKESPSVKKEEGTKGSKKRAAKESSTTEKKAKVASKAGGARGDNASIAPILAKGAGKALVLAPRPAFKDVGDEDLAKSVSQIITAVRRRGYCVSDTAPGIAPAIHQELRPCAPISPTTEAAKIPSGSAMLLGLSASLFAWSVDSFVARRRVQEQGMADIVSLVLNQEYGRGGVNERFRTVLQGSICLIGRAGVEREKASKSLGLGSVPLGGTAGEMDCNIGGVAGSCSDVAAVIQKSSSSGSSDFQFFATKNTDMVSLNGRQVKAEMGSFPLFNEDICTVGARVFVFLLPMDA